VSEERTIECACRDCRAVVLRPLGSLCLECQESGCDAFYTDCQREAAHDGKSPEESQAIADGGGPLPPEAGPVKRARIRVRVVQAPGGLVAEAWRGCHRIVRGLECATWGEEMATVQRRALVSLLVQWRANRRSESP